MKHFAFLASFTRLMFAAAFLCPLNAQDFTLNPSGYFNRDGVDVMAFDDFYPEGHQGSDDDGEEQRHLDVIFECAAEVGHFRSLCLRAPTMPRALR